MTFQRLLIANRGEIAIRIARAAAELGLPSVAVYSEDDAASPHLHAADAAVALDGSGPGAYLDIEQVVAVALRTGCDALHPGVGFLAENPALARRCAEAGIAFVGPAPEVLELFGDKLQARALAQRCHVPVLPGTPGATSVAQALEFLRSLGEDGAMMIKAVAGGGGRGIRGVHDAGEVAAAHARCASEAAKAFGNGDLYVERLLGRARHVEVQIVGDGSGVVHLGERECSLQRRHQKLVEIAPSPSVPQALREQLTAAALALAQAARYRGVGTIEFLVELDADGEPLHWYFMEANPRLQVEHTVTEMVTGVDIVQAQLRIAAGASLAELGLAVPPSVRGHAMQLRVNLETMSADGDALPAGGTLHAIEWPGGPGVRVDACACNGYTPNPRFDSMLAKLVVHSVSPHYADLVHKAHRALGELRIAGVATSQRFLLALLRDAEVLANRVDTGFVERRAAALMAASADHAPRHAPSAEVAQEAVADRGSRSGPPGCIAIVAPMDGVLVEIGPAPGALLAAGEQVAVIEAMKMEHLVVAAASARVHSICAEAGQAVQAGTPLLWVEASDAPTEAAVEIAGAALDHIRPDLAEAISRHAIGLDAQRDDAVARRHRTGLRTARENIADLVDAGSFVEYGALAVAAQRGRRSLPDLIRNTPADGMVAGLATVNAAQFGEQGARCAVLAYDYTVLAGTQGMFNHKKTDRLFQLAEQWRIPIVLFAEGGGGRPGDTDFNGVAGLDVTTFHHYARLSGKLPRVGIVAGRCFAGNAALLGCSDVIIATQGSSVGMGGPAMIEGGGLGVVAPGDVGPTSMQGPNGVIDVLVADEAAAVRAAKQYLSYFQGSFAEWNCADQRALRHCVPENRVRAYDMHAAIALLCDSGSVLELRAAFGAGMITALVRIEGRPMGLVANNPRHLGGAIDAEACDKAARFMQLCDAFALPIVSLCDTPGFMVGAASEATAMVRKTSRMFVTAASLRVPLFTIVLRKGYGLGAQAMAGGSFAAPFFCVGWPSGEFGAMGLEGAVRLGFRKELEAAVNDAERQALFERMVAAAYERGKALNMASVLEIDAVIDPAESRRWLVRALASVPPAQAGGGRFVDTW
jgi:acetyl/propionyl-CoA carboxylase alpha subunit